jgi:large conductance mechanosensitive channel
MVKEFKEFISQGRVLDLAVAVIIGGAIGKIIASLVGDILMPIIGLILGGINFQGLSITIGSASIKYGTFIQSIVEFLAIAICIFLFIKIIEKIKRFKGKKEAAAEEPTKQEMLLTEIRDLLKKD